METNDQQAEELASTKKGKKGASRKKKTSSAKQSSRPRTARAQNGQGGGASNDRQCSAANRTVQLTLNARHDNGPTPLSSQMTTRFGGSMRRYLAQTRA